MRFQILIFCKILIFFILLTGCPGGEQPKPNANSSNAQTNMNSNKGSNLATSKTPVETTTNEAPMLKPFFTAYCDAMTRKDDAALRKVYAASTLKTFEADMKAENEKSLSKYLEA